MTMMQVGHDRESDAGPTAAEQLRARAAAWSEARQRLRGAAALSDVATTRNSQPIDDAEPDNPDSGSAPANAVIQSIRRASRELHARRAEAGARSVELDTRELELGAKARELVDYCAVLTRRREELEQQARDLRDRHDQLQTLEEGLDRRLAELVAGEGELQAQAAGLRDASDALSLRARRSARNDFGKQILRRQRRCAARDGRVLAHRLEALERREAALDQQEVACAQRSAQLEKRGLQIAMTERDLVAREEAVLAVERAVLRQQLSLEGREARLATRRSAAGEAWLRIRSERAAAQRRTAHSGAR